MRGKYHKLLLNMSENESNNDQLRRSALSLLARREHSERELFSKIRRKFAAKESQIAEVLNLLKQQGLLSDVRFSESYARSRAERGFGPLRIALELADKGVASEAIDQALQPFEASWAEIVYRVWQKKFSTLPQDFSQRVKQTNFLRYRGFRAEDIDVLLHSLEKTDPTELV